ncbi:polysaccharide ABC transporter ATP-binding protein [Synechocystis salina]|uniref:ATP-binding cassette domain-containing protein n=1 Tax=Synechocystis salina LEGE 00031 TaxID=1828736 RepID=A0ABR9VWF3_9SYNC|nr:polysaccharide ABC transporter ATP-binding protein [Synechocystis salina]MBE9242839.1 ATP-binding cassette domain-containing protein [Synechocystis salina LEGE 00041]MBE9255679.1 ATP-binding cassette domain-containing protein [Synechocystis salina LEGE 00031]
MSDVMIRVENLGKKYMIGHQAEGRSNYVALRDVLADGAKSLVKQFTGRGKGDRQTKEEFWALKDVSFEVKRGECVGIIGRNGAGKSTLLKILSRITEPTTGRVELHGRVASLLEVGTGFHPELTGRENIYLNGAILGMTRAEIKKKFDEIVDFAEVERFLDTPVKRYSSGMYVRLAFAVAAHLEPEILVVDEVLAVGDAAFQKKCLGKMGDVATKEGRTVLFVSHNIDSINRICPKTIFMKNGSIYCYENTRESISKYIGLSFVNKNTKAWTLSHVHENKAVYFLRAIVHNKDQLIKSDFTVSEKIGITFEYQVMQEGMILTHGCNLFNEQGINILNSHDVVSDIRLKKRIPGNYTATVWIPENFLAEGIVTVGLAVLTQEPFIVHAHEQEVLLFKVTDPITGESARGNYVGDFPGVVRPILKWETLLCTKAL